MKPKPKPTLLIVDDEKNQREGLRDLLKGHYTIHLAEDAQSAITQLATKPITILLTDYKMPKQDGIRLIKHAKNRTNPPVCILMTAYGSEDTAVEAIKHGADDYISKGAMLLEHLKEKITRALKPQPQQTKTPPPKKQQKQPQQKHPPQNIIAESLAMQHILDIVHQAAPSSANILITGESGTGKELIAQAIHQLSQRATKPLITVHCAGLAPNLLESELFGHEKGAFTGAHERRIGRFEQANHSTIFLDEIGEINHSTQIKLLRILGERTFERVGSNQTHKTDVRLLAATNKNLRQQVQNGNFREDLYYRLRVVEILLPPLRQRPEDIPPLAQKFLQEYTRQNNKTPKTYTQQTLTLLTRFDWPGNIRELRAAIEHAVIFSKHQQIQPNDLPAAVKAQTPLADNQPTYPNTLSLPKNEKHLIQRALQQTKGNKTKAANLLQISVRTLHRKLKQQNLPH